MHPKQDTHGRKGRGRQHLLCTGAPSHAHPLRDGVAGVRTVSASLTHSHHVCAHSHGVTHTQSHTRAQAVAGVRWHRHTCGSTGAHTQSQPRSATETINVQAQTPLHGGLHARAAQPAPRSPWKRAPGEHVHRSRGCALMDVAHPMPTPKRGTELQPRSAQSWPEPPACRCQPDGRRKPSASKQLIGCPELPGRRWPRHGAGPPCSPGA